MASTLNVNAAGTTFFSGTSSGIDTASLIQNAVNAKLLPKARIDDKISSNLKKITAFQDIQTQVTSLKSLFSKLKTDIALGNVFDGKAATLSSSSATAASSLISVSTTKDAQKGVYSVVVNQLAKSFVAQGTAKDTYSDPIDADISGSLQLQLEGKQAVTITYDGSTTMQSLRDAINAQTATSGVSAVIVQSAPDTYRLVLKGADLAKNISVTPVAGTNILSTLGLTDDAGNFQDITQAAQQARITVDGVVINSNSNTFSSVFPGVTINALSSEPGTTITMKIDNDTSSVREAIKAAVDGYNTLRKKVADYRKVNEDGSVGDNAYLFGETVNKLLGDDIRRLVTGSYGYGAYNGLGSLGITINSSNNLEINYTTLNDALINHYDEVAAVFATGDKHTSSSNVLSSVGAVGVDGNFLITNDVSGIQIDFAFDAAMTLEQIRDNVNAQSDTLGMTAEIIETATGKYRLVFKGTVSGETFSVVGSGASDALGITNGSNFAHKNVGIADTFDTLLAGYNDSNNGYIAKAIEGLQSTNTSLTKRSDDIKSRTDAYQLMLVSRYAKLEAKIQMAQNARAQILAILNSKSNN